MYTYDSPILYNELNFPYNGLLEPIPRKISNFIPTFTGPPRDSHGQSKASILLWDKRNKDEEELLSLLGYF